MRLWPYRILVRSDEQIKADLRKIIDHFEQQGRHFDTVVFIPNAGIYLSEMFASVCPNSYAVAFVEVRRASSTARVTPPHRVVFRNRRLSNIARHFEVLVRLVKLYVGLRQKMVADLQVDDEVVGKNVLVIDDSVDTGTTLRMVKSALLEKGAASVTTACISNHLAPGRVQVDYSVYEYRLLRTRNSRDYHAV